MPNPPGLTCKVAMIPILRLLRAAAGSDRDLIDRYARDRDDEAFEALVRRYGPGVWAACVRLAGREAEDAFQASAPGPGPQGRFRDRLPPVVAARRYAAGRG
ncbi:MAG TPA: hypothetical protein VD866_00055 [Urbifossiella sp.]|nr:hypothetical protein [Urbifossiella sp.]